MVPLDGCIPIWPPPRAKQMAACPRLSKPLHCRGTSALRARDPCGAQFPLRGQIIALFGKFSSENRGPRGLLLGSVELDGVFSGENTTDRLDVLFRRFLSDFFSRSGVTNTPRGGDVNCAQVKILQIPLRSQHTLSVHPSSLEIGVLSSSLSVAPPTS